eukprot:10245798-Ditylum_brightwellii.AAC.1
MPTKPAGEKKVYYSMHGCNKTHNTEDCFELKRRAKRSKPDDMQNEADKVTYKDLNAFVNAKVTAAFNKLRKIFKSRRKKNNLSLTLLINFVLLTLKAAMRKTSLTSMLPPMWTTMTVSLLACSAIPIVIATKSEWQAMT